MCENYALLLKEYMERADSDNRYKNHYPIPDTKMKTYAERDRTKKYEDFLEKYWYSLEKDEDFLEKNDQVREEFMKLWHDFKRSYNTRELLLSDLYDHDEKGQLDRWVVKFMSLGINKCRAINSFERFLIQMYNECHKEEDC